MRMQVASQHAFSIALFLTTWVPAGQQVQRPAITGVSHVTFYTTTPDAARHFYGDLLGLTQNDHSNVFFVGRQAVQALAENPPNPPSLRSNIGFATANAEQLRRYLQSRGVDVPARSHIQMGRDGKVQLNVYDPDGTRVEFMEFTPTQPPCCSPFTASHPSPNYRLGQMEASVFPIDNINRTY